MSNIYVTLTGFGFVAIAGLGLGFVLNNFNRNRRKLGTGLFLVCLPAGFLLILLGLPS